MQRVLVTGMSGVGKSTVAERLSELGYKVVETDHGGYSVVDEHGYQHWDVDRVREVLATEDADACWSSVRTILRSCSTRTSTRSCCCVRPVTSWSSVSRPAPTIRSPRVPRSWRGISRSGIFEQSMRRAATHAIDTSKPPDRVVDEILSLVRQPPPT